jgi:hypothetical protein
MDRATNRDTGLVDKSNRLQFRLSSELVRVSLCAALLPACADSAGRRIEAEVSQGLRTHPTAAVISKYVPGPWDRMCVIMPYSPPESIDSLLGFHWSSAKQTGISSDDAHTLLLFVSRGKVMNHLMYPRAKGDFGQPVSRSYCVFRAQAVFKTAPGRSAGWMAVQLASPKK